MNRYAQAHASPQGPGDARPTALQVIHDEGLKGKMTDKVFLITGPTAGIGLETARALSATGARLFLLVRDLERAKVNCSPILAANPSATTELIECDVSSLSSVRSAAAAIRSKTSFLNVMVCNAGVMALPHRRLSADGFELQLATNYLGHFLLFWWLRDLMAAGSSAGFRSRLVNVASSGHHGARVRAENMNLEAEEGEGGKGKGYTPEGAYGQSKLAQIYMSNFVDRHFSGIHGWSVMPGGVVTNLLQHLSKEVMESWEANDWLMNKWMKNAEQGAATSVLAAVGKGFEARGGGYLEDCAVADADDTDSKMIPGLKGVDKIAFDEEQQDTLWEATVKLLGLEG